jgi:hypothetical protein
VKPKTLERLALFLLVLYCDLAWKLAHWGQMSNGLAWWAIALALTIRFAFMGGLFFMFIRARKARKAASSGRACDQLLAPFPSKGGTGRFPGSSTYWVKYTHLAPSDNRSTKSADGRVATEAAWLNGNNWEKEEINEAEREKKRKDGRKVLTLTGLLTEGVSRGQRRLLPTSTIIGREAASICLRPASNRNRPVRQFEPRTGSGRYSESAPLGQIRARPARRREPMSRELF